MPSFAFRARDVRGAALAGVLEGPDSAATAAELRRRGLLILELAPVARARREPSGARGGRGWLPATSFDLETGLHQLALLHKSGLTLVAALEAVAENARRRSMTRLWLEVAARIRAGDDFTAAVAAHPRSFPPLVRELLRTGEHSGTLERALERSAEHLARRRAMRGAMLRALFYPALVLVLTTAVSAYMVLEVVPVLEGFLRGFHRELPAMTRALLAVSAALRGNLPQVAIGLCATLAALVALDRWPPSKALLDGVFRRTPLLRGLLEISATAVFARTMATLLASGIDIVQALRLTAGVLPRPVPRRCIEQASAGILAGSSFAEGLRRSPAFRPILVRMIAVGERSGELDRVLDEGATFHEAELEAWIRRAGAWIEPVLTISVGAIVGFVYIAFFLGMFAVAGSA